MKAIYNGIRYNVLETYDNYVILEGLGGYTFKAYMENILLDKPEEKQLPSEKPDTNDVITDMQEDQLPKEKEDKSFIFKEMPYIDTPNHEGFDLGIEMFNKFYGLEPSEKKYERFKEFLKNIFMMEKVYFPDDLDPQNKFGDMFIYLHNEEEVERFKDELRSGNATEAIEKYIGKSVENIINEIEEELYTLTENNIILEEFDMKDIATHPDLVDAIKTVYSIRGVGDRKGEYSPERAVGMLKRAAEIITQYDKEPLTPQTYLQKIIEWLKLSGERGKGRKVNGLDELYDEILTDIEQYYSTEKEKETDQGETKMDPDIKKPIQKIIDAMEGNTISIEDINNSVPELANDPEKLNKVMEKLAELGIEVTEEELTENGVAAVAGTGCIDGSVSQAVDGQQGIAIRPSRMGGEDYRRELRAKLEESVKYDIEETEVPVGTKNPSHYDELKIPYKMAKWKEDQQDTEEKEDENELAIAEEFGDDDYTGRDEENPWSQTEDELNDKRKENEKRRKSVIEELREKVQGIMNLINEEEFEFDDDENELDDIENVDTNIDIDNS